jgi:hypothetical protein
LRLSQDILEVSYMKQKNSWMFFVGFVVSLISLAGVGISAFGAAPSQQVLSEFPAISVAGKNMQFGFTDDAWIAKVEGKDFLKGTYNSEDTQTGSVLTLVQTHVYSDAKKPVVGGDVGWVKTSGPQIILEYIAGPPASLLLKK